VAVPPLRASRKENELSRDIQRRLSKLETNAALEESTALGAIPPDWPLEDQAEDLLEALLLHRCGGSAQACTDRQINVLGILHAMYRLPGGVGEYRMPSGVVVSLTDNGDDVLDIRLSGNVSIEDLPDSVQRHIKRIEPDKQPERERWLYARRDQPKQRLFLEKYRALAVAMVRGEVAS
jgi:hypothetical protein